MSRYDEIINESDLEECTPVTTQFESTPTTSGPGVYTVLISWMSTQWMKTRSVIEDMQPKGWRPKDDESVIRFRNSGKFRDIKWKILKHDRLDEKPLGDWLGFEPVMELAPGTQGNDFMIKQAKR